MEFLLSLYVIANFVGAGKRASERDPSLKTTGLFILEFAFYPVIRAIEEFKIDIMK